MAFEFINILKWAICVLDEGRLINRLIVLLVDMEKANHLPSFCTFSFECKQYPQCASKLKVYANEVMAPKVSQHRNGSQMSWI